jgi:hypothetical protein
MDCRVKPGNDDLNLALMRFRGDDFSGLPLGRCMELPTHVLAGNLTS